MSGLAVNTSPNDILDELASMGINRNQCSARIFQRRKEWLSFMASVPKSLVGAVYGHEWPEGIVVRPFREQQSRQEKRRRIQPAPQNNNFQGGRRGNFEFNRGSRWNASNSGHWHDQRPYNSYRRNQYRTREQYPNERVRPWGNDGYENSFPPLPSRQQ